MASTLTEVDVFTATITVPDPGDDRKAASVITAFQALTNRSLNLKNRLDGFVDDPHTWGNTQNFSVSPILLNPGVPAEIEYDTPPLREVLIPMVPTALAGWTQGNTQAFVTTSNSKLVLHFGVECVPRGSVLRKVRAGLSLANTVTLEVARVSPGTAPPGPWVELGTPLTSSYTPSGTEAVNLDVDMAWTVSNSDQRYRIGVTGTSGLSIVYWLKAFFDDPGPRNG